MDWLLRNFWYFLEITISSFWNNKDYWIYIFTCPCHRYMKYNIFTLSKLKLNESFFVYKCPWSSSTVSPRFENSNWEAQAGKGCTDFKQFAVSCAASSAPWNGGRGCQQNCSKHCFVECRLSGPSGKYNSDNKALHTAGNTEMVLEWEQEVEAVLWGTMKFRLLSKHVFHSVSIETAE